MFLPQFVFFEVEESGQEKKLISVRKKGGRAEQDTLGLDLKACRLMT